MQYLLFALSLLIGAVGVLGYLVAQSSVHEIQAAVMLLIAAVLLVGAAIVDAVARLRKEVRDSSPHA